MSTQYNSRFSGKYLKLNPLSSSQTQTGGCCKSDGEFEITTKFACDGHYLGDSITDTALCPNASEIGICCSCGAVPDPTNFDTKSNTGIETGLTKCECERKGGVWRAGTGIDISSLTLKQIKKYCTTVYGVDTRLPKACCYSEKTGNDTFVTVCEDVCTATECSEKGDPNTNKTFYSGGRRCLVTTNFGEPVNNECTAETTLPNNQLSAACSDGVDCFSSQIAGNCCTYDYSTNTVSCSTTTQTDCSGWWLSSAYGIVSCEDNYCGQIKFPTLGVIPQPPTENLAQIQASTNIFKKLPQAGEKYQGGIYVGIFNTALSSTPSTVFGNSVTGNGQDYTVRHDPFGAKNKRWILIVHPNDYGIFSFTENNQSPETLETSYYDGFFNTYGNGTSFYGPNSSLFTSIRKSTINGFADWYIPSQDEAAFISKELNYNFYIPNEFESFESSVYYLTSTAFFNRNSNSVNNIAEQDIKSNYFVYGHHYGKPTVGRTTIVSRYSPLNVRLCRRIYLED
jgi:hypothetical protein